MSPDGRDPCRGDVKAIALGGLPRQLLNTRSYRWLAHRRYRCRIDRSPEAGWRGTVTDLSSGTETVVRDLWVESDHLEQPVVWTEAFGDCDHPSVAVRWSDLTVVTTDGRESRVDTVRVNYQNGAAGGCANTDVSVDHDGWVQRTGVARRTPSGTLLRLDGTVAP